jgi:hypothetical protein
MIKKKKRLNEKASVFSIILFAIIIVLCLILILILTYILYLNFPSSPEPLDVVVNSGSDIDLSLSEVKQFYPNMRFNHNSISYNIDSACSTQKKERISQAFDEISGKVQVISFYSDPDSSDIILLCSENKMPAGTQEDYFIAGEGGAKEIIKSGEYNVISSGLVLLYAETRNSLKCEESNVEVHELMHVLGFNHSASANSLMYPLLETCEQRIDDSIINELKRLYSIENLPDLLIENLSVVKKGRYLDFNITIRNSGITDSQNIEYSIFDDGVVAETRIIPELKYGSGIFIQVQNFKLIHREPSEIKFIIDNDNKIKELDEGNNFAIVRLNA